MATIPANFGIPQYTPDPEQDAWMQEMTMLLSQQAKPAPQPMPQPMPIVNTMQAPMRPMQTAWEPAMAYPLQVDPERAGSLPTIQVQPYPMQQPMPQTIQRPWSPMPMQTPTGQMTAMNMVGMASPEESAAHIAILRQRAAAGDTSVLPALAEIDGQRQNPVGTVPRTLTGMQAPYPMQQPNGWIPAQAYSASNTMQAPRTPAQTPTGAGGFTPPPWASGSFSPWGGSSPWASGSFTPWGGNTTQAPIRPMPTPTGGGFSPSGFGLGFARPYQPSYQGPRPDYGWASTHATDWMGRWQNPTQAPWFGQPSNRWFEPPAKPAPPGDGGGGSGGGGGAPGPLPGEPPWGGWSGGMG